MGAITWTGTSNSSDIKIYVNGIGETYFTSQSGVSSRVSDITNKLFIGNADFSPRPFNGNISQVSIYNRAPTASEVLQNYNATKSRFGL